MTARDRIGAILGRAGSCVRGCAGARRARGASRRGFTLIEILIAVGALGLIAVGISQVFRATGDTVRAGRRISNLNAYAALIERQLRDDFAAMTRDGFLLIRHERVWLDNQRATSIVDARPTGPGVPLVQGHNASRRPRRADEIVFFATGDYVTKRPPVILDRVARAPAARIYIGHGMRRDPKGATYAAPVLLSDDNTTGPPATTDLPHALGITRGPNQPPAPNEEAATWTLLRHVTLLAPPSWAKVDGTASGITGAGASRLLDGRWQIAGQPAVPSVFRAFNGNDDGTGLYNTSDYAPRSSEVIHEGLVNLDDVGPGFGSGAIDIAATDLAEIRALIHAATTINDPQTGWRGGQPGDLDAPGAVAMQDTLNGYWPTSVPHMPLVLNGFGQNTPVAIIHAWMREALPVNSDAPRTGPRPDRGGRMRYEPTPPNPLCIDVGTANFTDPNSVANALRREMERADQLMLSAHNFVPGCSEFIVEWSWGDTYPVGTTDPRAGQIVWHGLERGVDLNGNGNYDQPAEQVAAAYIYNAETQSGIRPYRQRFLRKDGSLGHRWVQGRMINTNEDFDDYPGTGPDDNISYSYFGYIDPTYRPAAHPDNPNATPPIPNPGLLVDNGTQGVWEPNLGDVLNDPETIPWPWPKLIRITMSLVDPSEPTVEQTYQFIFELPGDPMDPRY